MAEISRIFERLPNEARDILLHSVHNAEEPWNELGTRRADLEAGYE